MSLIYMKDIREFENHIFLGDCLELLKEIPDNSVVMIFMFKYFSLFPQFFNIAKFINSSFLHNMLFSRRENRKEEP